MKEIHFEDRLLDFYDDVLPVEESKVIEFHIKECASCRDKLSEIKKINSLLANMPMEIPGKEARTNMLEAIRIEKKLSGNIDKSKTVLRKKSNFISYVIRYAAVVALMLFSYFFGEHQMLQSNQANIINLENEHLELRSENTLMLIENSSASKRVKAMKNAEEMVSPNKEILEAIIRKMHSDSYVSVRLAAAQALSKFYEIPMVREALILELARESDPNMQIELIQILVDIQEKRAIPQMKKLLEDDITPEHLKDQIKTELAHLI